MALSIELVESATADARALVDELETELSALYPAENRHGFTIEKLLRPGVLFFLARDGADPVGCGGVAFDDGVAEVKRMYVRPRARRRGVARALLDRIESEARARGHVRLFLETGDVQRAAIACYTAAAFGPCQAFGSYAVMSANQIQRSRFFEKPLR
jgi:GNAT superfamily N-acetyltransferase